MAYRVLVVLSLCSFGALADNNSSTEAYSLRLEGGASRCQGEVQIQKAGLEWKGVHLNDFTLELGNRVCAALGCETAQAVSVKESSKRDVIHAVAACEKTLLIHCFEKRTSSIHSVVLNCSDSVRLFSGPSLCSGSLQIHWDQSWTSVCEGDLDLRGAEVVCRELSCGAPSLLQGMLFGKDHPPLGQMFHCEGNESTLMDCPRTKSGNCPSRAALHLTCSEPVRLVGGASRCAGTVQVRHRGEWRLVSLQYSSWFLKASAGVCRDLDCGSVISSVKTRRALSTSAWLARPQCVVRAALRECASVEVGSTAVLEVTCSDSVRLFSGPSLCSGSLQIHWDQSWTSVCEGDLDLQGAEVVCRELSCGAPSLLQGMVFGKDHPPLGQMFHCEGNESTLMDCPRTKSGNCPSGAAVHLTCSEPVRLVGGASRCAGTAEVKQNREWKRIETSLNWNLEASASVCRDLHCGSAVLGEQRLNCSSSPVWIPDADCMRKGATVRDCVLNDMRDTTRGLEVVCSDLLNQPIVSLSSDGVYEAHPQGFRVLLGSLFSVRCSVEPQFPGGSFQLISPSVDPSQNHTLPAVNHSAIFLFADAGFAHKGGYTCVYHQHVFNHHFSSRSHTLQLYLGVSDSQLITRALILLLLKLLYLIPNLYYYFKATRGHQKRQRDTRLVD